VNSLAVAVRAAALGKLHSLRSPIRTPVEGRDNMKGRTLSEKVWKALDAKEDLLAMRVILVDFAAQGGTAAEAAAELAGMRVGLSDEGKEDRILELLDIVHCYCAVPLQVWPP
jgi:hypothetical protein